MKTSVRIVALFGALLAASATWAAGPHGGSAMIKVSVTNVTKGQYFTPIIAASHTPSQAFFAVGQPASEAIAAIAEGGDVSGLKAALEGTSGVSAPVITEGLLAPGETVAFMLPANRTLSTLSFAAMLLPTNDAFVALDRLEIPFRGRVSAVAMAYDAGTEYNDEMCVSIPGPMCGGEGLSPNSDGEGFVHVHAGIQGIGDLPAAERDWNNPVAIVSVERVHR